ncbi:G-type lectin S-receptor serine/threonine-protein kinase RKS1 [Trifolium repens]|nr:G-type lectin S-receptor serine/threonine-protein kinase RKS1 [Trifolium repens]
MDSTKSLIYLVTAIKDKLKWLLINSLIILLTFSLCSCSSDTISSDKPIRDGDLLISKSKTFALGFFSPGKTTSRYVGIWYNNLPIQTVVWVANRDNPINDTSGILSVNPDGNLVLHHNLSTIPIWSTNVSIPQSQKNSTSVIAQLSDIANLVLMLNNTKTVIWESFDHPTDTLLPYQRLGFDRKTNQSWFLQSWKTDDDPGKGAFTLKFSTIGIPNVKRNRVAFNISFVEEENHVALAYNMLDKSVITSNCDPFNFDDFKCTCLPGFEPKLPRDWYDNGDGSGGCVRKKGESVCGNGEGFVKVVSLKVPDTSVAIAKGGLSLEECEKECLRNCSCTAYVVANVSNGESGCLAWHGDLMDIQKLTDQGQDLFLRVDKVELANYYSKSKGVPKKRLAAILVASIVTIVIFVFCVYCRLKKKRKDKLMRQLHQDSSGEEDGAQSKIYPNLPFFSFKTIMTATRNCCHEHKLGQGGFGSVYKGCLVNGQEIAVKRLSRNSGQGKEEFKNEVTLLVKLQHRNC